MYGHLQNLKRFAVIGCHWEKTQQLELSFINIVCFWLQAIYVPADDLTDPAPATTFAHLDATTVLSRGIAELGIYPAVDPLDSTSRIMDPNVVGQEHYDIARGVQKILQVNFQPYTNDS